MSDYNGVRMNGIKQKFGPLVNFEFDKLFLGQVFSHFADAIAQFLLVAILLSMSGSAGKSIAIMFFVFLLPQFLLSPFSGTLCDRFSRKIILSISCLLRAITVSIIIFLLPHISQNIIYIFAFVLGTGAAFFYPAKMSAVTNVIKSNQLKFANALTSSIGAIALLFGAFAADYLAKIGFEKAFSVVGGLYLTASVLTALIQFVIPQNYFVKKEKSNDMALALNYLKKHKKALYLVGLSIGLQFIVAVFSNSLNALITDYYGLTFSDLTYLRTLLGVGIVAGMGTAIYFARIMRIPHLFASSFMILCFALVTAPLCKNIENAWMWLIPIGMADAVVIVMLDTILQKITPDKVRGKIFGLQLTFSTLSFLIGTAVAANFIAYINPLNIFKGAAFLSFVLSALILIFDKSFRYLLLKATLGQIFLLLFRYRVEGAENIPRKGKVILAGNHTGHLDPFIVQMATNRQLWFVTGPAAFKVPIVRHLLKYYNVLPLNFGKGLESIENANQKLNSGEAVIIFPEGKFTPNGELCKFNRGVGLMAKATNAPIIPFAIKGGFETWGGGKKFPKIFNEIVIQFGQPITEFENSEKDIAHELQTRVNFMKKSLERRQLYKIDHKLHSNFLDLMQEKGDIYGQVRALSLKTKDGYRELSYIEISRKSKKFANYLIENSAIQRGDRIAIICESRPEFSIGIFASIQVGAITVPLDVKLTTAEHTHILNDCNPRILLCSSHYLEHALEVKNNVLSVEQIFVLDDDGEQISENCPLVSALEADIEKNLGRARSLDETALIVYTSGTTGNPKGVMISFGNIYSQLRDFENMFKLTNKHTLLSILPLNHLLELDCGFFGMLYMGAKVVYIKSLNPKELITVMKEKEITNMIVVPLLAKMLKNSMEKQIKKQSESAQKAFKVLYKLAKFMPVCVRRLMFKSVIDGLGGKLECFICGGAPLDDSVAEFFDRIGIPVFQGYGLTETSPTISTNRYRHSKIGTVGQALPSVMVKIAENGEILATGPNVMQGYYNKPEMTKEVIDEEGWFHTGDIGEIDKNGFIKITGRIKNMIVLGGGKKIFPEEVEAVLEKSNLIKEVCVMSLAIISGNRAGTEEVGAIICPSDDLLKKSDEEIKKELEAEVKRLAGANLAPYKTPTSILLHREELPKTSTRKVKRKVLKEWYEKL
ncbi:MFS transporter [bacterium]|nr:MFS transporter [bacterium]